MDRNTGVWLLLLLLLLLRNLKPTSTVPTYVVPGYLFTYNNIIMYLFLLCRERVYVQYRYLRYARARAAVSITTLSLDRNNVRSQENCIFLSLLLDKSNYIHKLVRNAKPCYQSQSGNNRSRSLWSPMRYSPFR